MTRALSALDPMPSLDELWRLYRARTGREIVAGASPPTTTPPTPVVAALGPPDHPTFFALRDGDTVRLVLRVAPRTKKNHGRAFGIRQSTAYVTYRDAIVNLLAPFLERLSLPLPPQPYNIRAWYFVDVRGQRADRVGLDQGLYDALENAGVVSDDFWFRQSDGTRVFTHELHDPRVEVLITPCPEESP